MNSPATHPSVAPDSWRAVSATLTREFAGTLPPAVVAGFISDTVRRLAATATVVDHLAVLAERVARDRLRALASTDGNFSDTLIARRIRVLEDLLTRAPARRHRSRCSRRLGPRRADG